MNKLKKSLYNLLIALKLHPLEYKDYQKDIEVLERALRLGQYLFMPIRKLGYINFKSEKHPIEELSTREAKLTFSAKITYDKKVLNESGDFNYVNYQLVESLKEYIEQD